MTFQRYYEDELAYLRQLGDAFGRANPAIAGMLAQDAVDPDVERLMEGFAFLTGRLRQRLDEELPELSQGLLMLLWPHYLRPIPAMSILEFRPAAASPVVVPGGSAVASRPVRDVSCRFRTCGDTTVLPVAISDAALETRASSALLSLELRLLHGAKTTALALQPLRLFLNGGRDQRLGLRLLRTLLADVRRIEIKSGSTSIAVPVSALTHAGFDDEEAVLPWPENGFSGYRILQEYLVFPERFLFVQLAAQSQIASLSGDRLRIEFEIDRVPDLPARLGPEMIRVNCVPVINLADGEAEPIAPEPGRGDYRLTPAYPAVHGTVYAVNAVRGLMQGSIQQRVFHSFESLRHAFPGEDRAFYTTRLRPSTRQNRTELWASFTEGERQEGQPRTDTLIASIAVTDGELAELVPVGGIDQVAVGSPASMAFSNITPVTPELPPPLHGDLLWRLVSGLARSLAPLENVASLQALITSYDFRAAVDEQERRRLDLLLNALRVIETEPMVTLVQGVPVRGRHIKVSLDEAGFGGPEGAYLFGAVLDRYVGVHANVNTCHQLSIEGVASKIRFDWPIRSGRIPVS